MKTKIDEVLIREAAPSDAEQLIAFVNALADEPGIHIGLTPGEFNLGVDEERDILKEYASSENSIFFVAEFQGEIIANLNCRGGTRKATKHAVTLGMSVSKAWRNLGVGSMLLQHAVEWAKENPFVSRIELNVFTENSAAIHLYSKFGFQIEGLRKESIFRNNKYNDDFVMALLL
jgi:ribosomal protein S18 acetylase RimI-like enzyme